MIPVVLKESDFKFIFCLPTKLAAPINLGLGIGDYAFYSGNKPEFYLKLGDSTLEITKQFLTSFSSVDWSLLYLSKHWAGPAFLKNPELVFEHFQIPNSKAVERLLLLYHTWSDKIKVWIHAKSFRPQELTILAQLSTQESEKIIKKCSDSLLSKSDSLQLIEILSELLLMKTDVTNFMDSEWTNSSLEKLHSLRYPLGLNFHPLKKLQIKWPKGIQSQIKRHQDKMGFQLQWFSSEPIEARKILTQLTSSIDEWEQQIIESKKDESTFKF